MSSLAFTVVGVPQQMGSKRAFLDAHGHPHVTDTNKSLKGWQALMQQAASNAILLTDGFQLLEGPVRLTLAFYLPRPKSLPKKYLAHTKAPDCDKLVRAAGDALSKVVYRDDAQVCEIVAAKYYAPEGTPPYCTVTVEATLGIRPTYVPAAPMPLFADAPA